jgi:hypothetical protein
VRARYWRGEPSAHIEITLTRVGTWLVECPCGWSQDFGPDLDLPIAKEYAVFHRRRCLTHRKAKIAWEVNTDLDVAS